MEVRKSSNRNLVRSLVDTVLLLQIKHLQGDMMVLVQLCEDLSRFCKYINTIEHDMME